MKKTMIMLAMAATTLMSCSKVENANDGTEPVAINFGANVAVTKAVIESDGNNLPTATINNVQVIRGTDGDAPAWDAVTSITTTGSIETSGAFTIADEQYMNADKTSAANFLAYYPAASAINTGVASFTIDGKTDILVAPAQKIAYSATPTCALPFAHALTQVQLVVKAKDAAAISNFGKLTAASINAESELELTLATQAVTEKTGNLIDFKFYTGDTEFTSSAITTGGLTVGQTLIPAMTLTKINLAFENRPAQDYNLSAELTLKAGEKHIITATVNATTVTLTATVAAWGDGEDGGLDID